MITEGPLDALRLSEIYYRGWRSMTQKTRPDALTDPFHPTSAWIGTPIYDALAREMGINPAPSWLESQWFEDRRYLYGRFFDASFFPNPYTIRITGLGA